MCLLHVVFPLRPHCCLPAPLCAQCQAAPVISLDSTAASTSMQLACISKPATPPHSWNPVSWGAAGRGRSSPSQWPCPSHICLRQWEMREVVTRSGVWGPSSSRSGTEGAGEGGKQLPLPISVLGPHREMQSNIKLSSLALLSL